MVKLHINKSKLVHSALLENMQSTQDSWAKTVESLVQQIETNSLTPAPKGNPAAIGKMVESCLIQQHLDYVGHRLEEAIGIDSRLSFYGQLAAGKEYQIDLWPATKKHQTYHTYEDRLSSSTNSHRQTTHTTSEPARQNMHTVPK